MPDLRCDPHQFEDADATNVAGLAALAAANRAKQRRAKRFEVGGQLLRTDCGLAMGAQPPDESLGEHALDRAGDQIRLDAHVDQSRDRPGSVVGVQRAEHEVSGQRRLDRRFSRLAIADLADQDDVWIMPQNASQTRGERQPHLVVHLDLTDAWRVVLDWILDGDDLDRRRLDLVEGRIQRRRLARPGRPGHQHDPVRQADELVERAGQVPRHADAGQVELHPRLVEKSQHDALAMHHRNDAGPHVDLPTGDPHVDAAVLRQPLLGDVEAGHDLQPRDDRRSELPQFRRRRLHAKNAIDPKADREPRLGRLDVHVRRTLLDCLDEQLVDQTNDRRGLGVAQLGGLHRRQRLQVVVVLVVLLL